MVELYFFIRNPWGFDVEHQPDLYMYDRRVGTYKHFEVQVSATSPYNIFSFHVNLGWRGEDHAGPHLEIDVMGISARVQLYDRRHWDYENATWER